MYACIHVTFDQYVPYIIIIFNLYFRQGSSKNSQSPWAEAYLWSNPDKERHDIQKCEEVVEGNINYDIFSTYGYIG